MTLVDKLPERTNAVDDVVVFYVVYDNPTDYIGQFVVRKQAAGRGGMLIAEREPYAVCADLASARASIPAGLVCLARSPEDEPQIVESWL